MTQPVYAIPDIHGHAAELDRALALVAADGGPEAEIVFLGDLVDRGPDSCAVINLLIAGQKAGLPWRVLKGNHDSMFDRFLSDGRVDDPRVKSGVPWIHPRLGGLETLASYGVDTTLNKDSLLNAARKAVPADHHAFLEAMPRYFKREKLLFVHAGVRPGVPLADQDPEDLIWIRDPFLDYTGGHPWLVVHGHTALDHPRHFGNRIDLDGGAGFGRPIRPAVFEGRDCWLLTDQGRQPLTP